MSTAKSLRSQIRRPYGTAASLALLLIVLATQFEGRLFEAPYAWLFLGVALGAQRIDNTSDRALRKGARTQGGVARIAMVHDIAGVAKVQVQILQKGGDTRSKRSPCRSWAPRGSWPCGARL